MGMRVDVADDSSVESLFSDIHESFGSPIILVNNAGITRDNFHENEGRRMAICS